MKRTLITAVAVAVVLVGGIALIVGLKVSGGRTAATADEPAARYHCPMHPTYTSDKPGDCPICGMKLVPIEEGSGSAGASGAEPATASGVSGRAVVTISPERRQVLGVRSEPVTKEPSERRIRTVGRVTVDERRLHHVHTKFEGYVEHLYVDFIGKLVKRGEPLLSIYSPELVATQQEYLLAYRAQKQLGGERRIASVAQGGVDLLEAARQRLLLLGHPPRRHRGLEKTGQVMRTLDLYSDISGYVVQKMAVHGMRVTPADTLFDIADLSHLWVLADVYESDLPSLRLGMEGRAQRRLPARQGVAGPRHLRRPDRRGEDAHGQGAGRGREPGRGAEAGHVRGRPPAERSRRGPRGPGQRGDQRRRPRRLVFLDRGDGRLEPREVQLGVKRIGEGFAGPVRPRGGRSGRDLGQLPARLGVEPQGRALRDAAGRERAGDRAASATAARTSTEAVMIQAIIRFSANNRVPRAAGHRGGRSATASTPCTHIPVDAIPDLSDTQVIVYSRWDRSPDIMEDQVTYPIVTALLGRAEREGHPRLLRLRLQLRLRHLQGRDRHLLGAQPRPRVPLEDPAAAARRGEDGARARRHRRGLGLPVRARGRQPTRTRSPTCARSRTGTSATGCSPCPGVAEVASLGGFVQQYQVTVDPNRLKAYDLAIMDVAARRPRQQQRGGRPAARVRAAGSTWSAGAATCAPSEDLEKIVLKTDEKGTPVLLRDVGDVVARARDPARGVRPRRHGATRWAASWSCATGRTPAT